MSVCKTLVRSSILSLEHQIRRKKPNFSLISHQSFRFFSNSSSNFCFASSFSANQGSSRRYGCVAREISNELTDSHLVESVSKDLILKDEEEEETEDFNRDRIEELLTSKEKDIARLMKMERRLTIDKNSSSGGGDSRWFPYLDMFKAGYSCLTSNEILEAVNPLILDVRKERMKKVVQNRSYSVCLVVEGLTDYGNVSATCRSADALGFQSIHVVSCDSSKRYRDNRHVSMGAEKWLDIEVWNSTQECFNVLKSRGYRIATTHVGMDAVSIYDMDWSVPTAIVVGNESRGISQEALELSDMHCSIPMRGMVDSFNVSVAAGILMHQAVCDRTSRLVTNMNY
ncbi:hypothetical protein AQUCO_02600143v1 [Aquilegia coerulea]|uniref:tRNA/rRNA methyltransferase SpoU type domain-containing protein n=1 Tax=Aquilegia coerulea TaxID=218851 RepID=A0A2G5D7K3_AQUCA|nr:hypothetical protein AQUCO_02600143v1 [Aquilegia coerulea]